MTPTMPPSPATRFAFSERAEPLHLRRAAPGVHGYAWRPPAPVATLILVHGLQSHAQWFAECAESLFARGIAVYALDRRGSGASPGVRGDIGRYTEWFDEVAAVVDLARADHPGLPAHLVGHCFGANLALGCALTRRPDIRSLVMLTPGLYILPDYRPWAKLRILACGLLRPRARFPVPQDDDLFTRDPEVLAWIRQDALGARTVTARCLLETRRMVGWLRRNLDRLAVPLLVLEAARDRISDNRRHRRLLDRRLRDRCRLVSFDAEHFLLAEPCREQVIDALVGWVGGGEEPRRHGG